METKFVEIRRTTAHTTGYFEIKDPTVIQMPDGTWQMYASVGTSVTQSWFIGHFEAQHPAGPWQELEPVKMIGVEGSEVCAPQVLFDDSTGTPLWKMYVQTTCFHENGVIAVAQSTDGTNFVGLPEPAMTQDRVPPSPNTPPVVGLYDVAISEYTQNGKVYECMMFSGYRRIGCGDLYMSVREKSVVETKWDTPRLILAQEDVPYHNNPGSLNFEWGLEGAKLVQLAENAYIMIGVCFLEKGHEHRGTRQRVFLAAAETPFGPFTPISLPLEPTKYESGQGENGHPDTIDLGSSIGILYQERTGDGKPWHLRYTEIGKDQLQNMVRTCLAGSGTSEPSKFSDSISATS